MDFNASPLYWAAFLAFVAVLLALDPGILNRKAHAPSLRESAVLTSGVIASIVYNRRHPGEHTHIKGAEQA